MEDKKSALELKRAKTKEQISKSSLILNIAFTLIVNFSLVFFIQIVAIAIVLGIDDGSCDKPIRYFLNRQWLIVWAVVNGFLIIVYILSQIKKINVKVRKFLYSYIFMCGGLFNFAWMIVGSVWEFKSDDCYDDFYNGWALTLTILIIDYVSIGLVCCIVCCACITAGGILLGASKFKEEDIDKMEKELEKCMDQLKNAVSEAQAKAQAETKKEEKEEKEEASIEMNQV